MAEKILLVEDDDVLRDTLQDFLELEGYDIKTCSRVESALEAIEQVAFDLIILDIMLPDGDGYQVARVIQKERPSTMILMLTARELEKDLVEGFEAGADDYLTKPYRTAELLLRVRALIRRGNKTDEPADSVNINGFIINWHAHSVTRDGIEIKLSNKSFLLLKLLHEGSGRVFTRDEILDAVWGEDIVVDNRTVDNFISNLKKQLNLQPDQEYTIRSIRGVGYGLFRSE